MSDIIMHCYDASPFTQRVLRVLGIKGLDWRWVETPMAPPKDEVSALTGGYRGTPVMQIGSDIYIDSQLIALEIENRFPQPSLFPAGDRGLSLMLVKWADAFFIDAMSPIARHLLHQYPQEFQDDRAHVFSRWGIDELDKRYSTACSQLRAHGHLINDQLSDGRRFLTGDRPGMADIQAFSVPWIMRAGLPELASSLWQELDFLPAWEARVADLGEGNRQPCSASVAFDAALSSVSQCPSGVADNDPDDLAVGQAVTVSSTDTRRGSVTGKVWASTYNSVSVTHRPEAAGDVVVHFPRLNYEVNPIAR